MKHFLLLLMAVSLIIGELYSRNVFAVETEEKGKEKSSAGDAVIDKWIIPHDETVQAKFFADLGEVFSRYRGNLQARLLYEEAVAREKNDELKSGYFARIAEMYIQDRDIKNAVTAYENAVKLTKNNDTKIKYYQTLGRHYEQLQMYEEGITAYTFLLEQEKEEMKKLPLKRSLYTMYNKLGRIDDVIKKETGELQENPESVSARENLVFIYWHILNRHVEAAKYLEELAKMTKVPDNRKYLNQAVQLYNAAGMHEKQAETLLKIVDQVPNDQKSSYMMRAAQVYADGGIGKKAIELADKVLEGEPENPITIFQAADVHKRSMDEKKADELFEKAFSKATENMQKQTMLYQYAISNIVIKNYAAANALFERQEKFIAENEIKLQLYSAAQNEFEQAEQMELAEKWAKKPIEMDPNLAIPYINAASFYSRNKKPEEARKIIKQGMEVIKNPEEKFHLLAWVYNDSMNRKDIEGARKALKEIKETTKNENFLRWASEEERKLNQQK